MARTTNRLSAAAAGSIKAAGYHCDGGGLYLRVTETGSRGWIFRYSLNGRTRDAGLGSYPDVSLAAARKKAKDCRDLLDRGLDPIEDRNAKREAAKAELAAKIAEAAKSKTFDDCSKAYIAAHDAGWRNAKHRQQWTNTLKTYVAPVIGRLPVQAINTGLVMQILQPLWSTKPETATRVRGRIEAILDWARVNEFRTGENPARWRGHLDHLLPARTKVRQVKHHAALPYAEIGDFMGDLREDGSIGSLALQFLILTATRTSETLCATWSEIDEQGRVWTIPPQRMKAGKEHRVPLTDAAMRILKQMQEVRQNDFIFPGQKQGRPLSQMALLMLLRRMNRDDLTVHGFRSTFRDWASERTNFPRDVAEMALAHAISDAVEAAYRRGDLFEKRRRLMAAWAEFCAKPSTAGKVVSIGRGADHRSANGA
jgi:integrase